MEPTGLSWILGVQLRHLRTAARLSAENVAKEWLGRSGSLVRAIESGQRRLGKLELEGLVDRAYGRPDLLPRLEGLRAQVEAGNDKPIRDTVTMHPTAMMVHELERESNAAYGAILDQVPKLFQTEGYMLAQHRMAGCSEEEALGYTRAGLERQQRFLNMPKPPMTRIIATEGALDRAVHVPGQLELLLERIEHPYLELRIIPYSAGPHFLFCSFTVMEFEEFPSVLYTDAPSGGSLISDEHEIDIALHRWGRLFTVALNPEKTRAMIEGKRQHD